MYFLKKYVGYSRTSCTQIAEDILDINTTLVLDGIIQTIWVSNKISINSCCYFTAQVVDSNQGSNGNNGNQNNVDAQAVFHNDANTQVGQQVGSPDYFNNHPESK